MNELLGWDGPGTCAGWGGADWGDMQAGVLGTPYFFVLFGKRLCFLLRIWGSCICSVRIVLIGFRFMDVKTVRQGDVHVVEAMETPLRRLWY